MNTFSKRTEIDLNKCEHKCELDQSDSILMWMAPQIMKRQISRVYTSEIFLKNIGADISLAEIPGGLYVLCLVFSGNYNDIKISSYGQVLWLIIVICDIMYVPGWDRQNYGIFLASLISSLVFCSSINYLRILYSLGWFVRQKKLLL